MSVLEDELKDLEDDLKDSEDIVGDRAGPLPEPHRGQLAAKLTHAEGIIDQILDPNQDPSLDPPDAGSVDPLVNPSTLPQYAEACHNLAQKAHAESRKVQADHKFIGTKIKTVKNLLPDYRRLAGIT